MWAWFVKLRNQQTRIARQQQVFPAAKWGAYGANDNARKCATTQSTPQSKTPANPCQCLISQYRLDVCGGWILAEAVSILLKHAIIHFAVLLRKFNSLCAGGVPPFSAQNRRQPCRFDM
jgi:hypothetical protein